MNITSNRRYLFCIGKLTPKMKDGVKFSVTHEQKEMLIKKCRDLQLDFNIIPITKTNFHRVLVMLDAGGNKLQKVIELDKNGVLEGVR